MAVHASTSLSTQAITPIRPTPGGPSSGAGQQNARVAPGACIVLSGPGSASGHSGRAFGLFRPVAVAQDALHQLAGRGARQSGVEIDALRAPDGRQLRAAIRHQLRGQVAYVRAGGIAQFIANVRDASRENT